MKIQCRENISRISAQSLDRRESSYGCLHLRKRGSEAVKTDETNHLFIDVCLSFNIGTIRRNMREDGIAIDFRSEIKALQNICYLLHREVGSKQAIAVAEGF